MQFLDILRGRQTKCDYRPLDNLRHKVVSLCTPRPAPFDDNDVHSAGKKMPSREKKMQDYGEKIQGDKKAKATAQTMAREITTNIGEEIHDNNE